MSLNQNQFEAAAAIVDLLTGLSNGQKLEVLAGVAIATIGEGSVELPSAHRGVFMEIGIVHMATTMTEQMAAMLPAVEAE